MSQLDRALTLVAGFRAGQSVEEQSLMSHELMQNELLRYLDVMMVSREQRLAFVTASISRVLRYVVFTGAFLMIAFLRMLYMELVSQIILGGITAFFLGIMIFRPDRRNGSSAEGRRSASARTRSNQSMTW